MDGYSLGANVTIQQALETPSQPWPLRRAASQVGNRNIRLAATLGGHLGANEPCADLIPALMALDARLVLATEDGTVESEVADRVTAGRPDINWLQIEVELEVADGVTAGILLPGPGPVATPDASAPRPGGIALPQGSSFWCACRTFPLAGGSGSKLSRARPATARL